VIASPSGGDHDGAEKWWAVSRIHARSLSMPVFADRKIVGHLRSAEGFPGFPVGAQ
jgi:hypothetical protein